MREITISAKRRFDGRLLKVDVLKVKLENKRQARREVVRHPGAVAVLCRRPDGRFVFVRQFRKPVENMLLEVVAGTRAPGESPVACARRELTEETGYKPVTIRRLGGIYTAPGFCDEKIEVYFAELGGSAGPQSPDDDEKIERVCLSPEQFEAMIASGKIQDAKTLAAWMLFTLLPRRRRAASGHLSATGG